MISFKARLMRAFMRNRHLLKGRFMPETVDKNTSIEVLRRDMAPMFPEATQAMDEVCAFIHKKLGA